MFFFYTVFSTWNISGMGVGGKWEQWKVIYEAIMHNVCVVPRSRICDLSRAHCVDRNLGCVTA
jgi:hypothetical protein